MREGSKREEGQGPGTDRISLKCRGSAEETEKNNNNWQEIAKGVDKRPGECGMRETRTRKFPEATTF